MPTESTNPDSPDSPEEHVNVFGEPIPHTEDPDSPFYVTPDERVDDDSIDPFGLSNALTDETGDDLPDPDSSEEE